MAASARSPNKTSTPHVQNAGGAGAWGSGQGKTLVGFRSREDWGAASLGFTPGSALGEVDFFQYSSTRVCT